MRIHYLAGGLVILSLGLTAAMRAQETGPVDAVEAFHAALVRGDSTAAVGWLDPDVVIFESGGAEMSREEFASHHLEVDMEFSAQVERTITGRTHAVAGDVAWVLTRSRSNGTFRDREIDVVGTETMVLRMTAEGWRIVHIHWSSRRAG